MNAAAIDDIRRLRLTLGGRVQGVGLRPFVYRLAHTHNLCGWVANTAQGTVIEVEGEPALLEAFITQLQRQPPPSCRIDSLQRSPLKATGASGFAIRDDENTAAGSLPSALSLPVDLAICAACRAELLDPGNRRHRHPFIACTDCGPRWSALTALPWQRANTALAGFAPCARCRDEYTDPANRRFHAQNLCCPDCGPQLALWDMSGRTLARRDEALQIAATLLRDGGILGVKGLGGFHLMVDARNAVAIARLRRRKQRPHKPLAVMFEHCGQLAQHGVLEPGAEALLTSPAAPIVLLPARGSLPEQLAPDNPRLGALLPYTGLHLLLLQDTGFPLVATSGNRSGEPLCSDENAALERLAGIADWLLVHDRPILQPVDDSVMQLAAGRPQVLRAARGLAPLELHRPAADTAVYLAFGGHQKNTVALAGGGRIVVSPHIGDLGTDAADVTLQRNVDALQQLTGNRASVAVCDRHPDYRSTRLAQRFTTQPLQVQHHHAHIAAVMAEHDLDGEVLGIAWDGSGLGDDGELWGGEWLLATRTDYSRRAALRSFPLPGGEAAVRDPQRTALGLLFATGGGDLLQYQDLPPLRAFAGADLGALQTLLERGLNCPRSSSVGRLFDAVAALLGLAPATSFEGQAAMALQFAAEHHRGAAPPLPFQLDNTTTPWRVDLAALVAAVVNAVRTNAPVARVAARFHATLAAIAARIAAASAPQRVVLAGGCFQNRLLLEATVKALEAAGREVFWSRQLAPNDGALAVGQLTVAAARAVADPTWKPVENPAPCA